MNPLHTLQAALKKWLAIGGKPKPPKVDFTFTTPGDLSKREADAMAETIRKELEKRTGKKLIVLHLGSLPCNCHLCQQRAKAPWN